MRPAPQQGPPEKEEARSALATRRRMKEETTGTRTVGRICAVAGRGFGRSGVGASQATEPSASLSEWAAGAGWAGPWRPLFLWAVLRLD